MTQTTIKYPVSLSGIGIHCGVRCQITLRPAEAGTGVVFVTKGQKIPAHVDQISDTRLCTVIGHDERIATVEHLMAAIMGSHIDNIEIEVEGPEIPILDGSSSEFYFAIQSAGREMLSDNAPVLTLHQPVKVMRDDMYCELLPADEMSFSFEFAYFPSRCLQSHPCASFSLATGSFEHEIARARTFGMVDDIPKLQKANYALGASVDNAIGLDEVGVVNPLGLRCDDEPARHKVLDAMGDLLFLGSRLRAQFRGYGSGHAMHHALMKEAVKVLCLS